MSPKTTKFENLLEAVPGALVGMDQKGIIRFVNRQTESLFGYDRHQLIGNPIDTLVPEPLWQIYAEHRQDHFTDPTTRSTGFELELNGRQQDGTEFPINISLSSIDTGEVLLVITALGDVNQRKRAVQSAQHTEAMVEYSDDAIIGLTPDGTITSWNPAAEHMYGYSGKEIIGRSGDLLTPEDRPGELNAILARIKLGHYVEHAETTLVTKDGTAVPVSIAAAPIRDENGEIVGVSAVHRDLTEQKGALAFAESMAAIVECSEDAIISRTLDGIIKSWNPATARMFGYSSEEIVGRSIDLLVPQDRAGEMITMLAEISAGRAVCDFETTRIRKDGTVFPASLTVSPICNDIGAVVGASVIYRDVTKLKHAAQYARSLIEASLDPLETISPEGKITDVNEAAVKASGVPRNKLIGSDFSGYFTEPDKARQGYERVFEQGLVTDYPLTLRRQDGTLTDISCNASVYRDAGGNVLGVLAAARDMTQQKEAVEAAQHMATIIEYSDEAIISSTLDGIITSWNKAAERLYGYSREEIVGKSIQPVAPQDRPEEIKDILAKIRAGQRVEHYETNRVRKDGTVFPVSLTASPIRDMNGTIVGTTVICHEMTDHR